MSGICGVLYRDGRQAGPRSLAAMMEAMASWGPDGTGAWQEGPVALGHLALHSLGEPCAEQLPVVSRSGELVMTASARLDNRQDLERQLALPTHTPESTLLLAAYERWGEGCADRLIGDWSCAIWNRTTRSLFLARDHYGNTALHYLQTPSLLVFASSLTAVVAWPELQPTLSELNIAKYLLPFTTPVPETTPYREVLRLAPGHFLTLSEQHVRLRRYWFPEHSGRLILGSDEEYQEVLLAGLRESVHCRLRCSGPVGLLLSGGLDSGAIAALASPELQRSGQQLLAFSSVPRHPVDPGSIPDRHREDETPLIEAIANHVGGIDVTLSTAPGLGPIQGIEEMLGILGEPFPGAEHAYWLLSLLHEAAQRGVAAMLDGEGGNLSFSWGAPRYRHELARRLRWTLLLQELRGGGRRTGRQLRQALVREILSAFAPSWLLRLRARLRQGMREADPATTWFRLSLVNPELARRLDLHRRLQAAWRPPRGGNADRELQLAAIAPAGNAVGALGHQLAAAFRMEARSPGLDKRLIELCLAIPGGQWHRDGVSRRLIRRSLVGLLPDAVLDNTIRGVQAADIVPRLWASAAEVRDAVDRIGSSQLARHLLDHGKLLSTADRLLAPEPRITMAECISFLKGLTVGLFLSNYD